MKILLLLLAIFALFTLGILSAFYNFITFPFTIWREREKCPNCDSEEWEYYEEDKAVCPLCGYGEEYNV